MCRRQFMKRICNLFCVSYVLLCHCVIKMFLLKSISLLPITYCNMVGYRAGWPSPSNVSLKMAAALRKMVENTTAIPTPAITAAATPSHLPLPLEKGLSTNSYLNLKATRCDWVYLWLTKMKQAVQGRLQWQRRSLAGDSGFCLPWSHSMKMDWLCLTRCWFPALNITLCLYTVGLWWRKKGKQTNF